MQGAFTGIFIRIWNGYFGNAEDLMVAAAVNYFFGEI